MDPATAYLEKELSDGSRKAYRRGRFIRPAAVSEGLATRIVEAMPAFLPRQVMRELLITNQNRHTWVNHSMTGVVNKVLRSIQEEGKHFRLGRSGVHARLWEVTIEAPFYEGAAEEPIFLSGLS